MPEQITSTTDVAVCIKKHYMIKCSEIGIFNILDRLQVILRTKATFFFSAPATKIIFHLMVDKELSIDACN